MSLRDIDLTKFDTDALEDTLTGAVTEFISGVVEGAKADIKVFGKEIARDMITCAEANDREGYQECLAQLRGLAEVNRLRIVNEQYKLAKAVLMGMFKASSAVMAAAL